MIWLAATMAFLMASTVAYAGYQLYTIDHSFTKAPLHAAIASGANAPSVVPEVPDAFGNTSLNILVIGTDTRLPGQDASLGGFVDTTGRADVEMLVHVSADRSNATIVSIPRDTMVPIPDCVDQKGNTVAGRTVDLINSALSAGPGCQVDTVEAFTHVQIDHFIMVDFAGVVSLTDAVGGVQVCVTKAVHDPDSHLDLPAGTSTVVGAQALAFLRTREGFANGSDVYRTQAQHQYLSSRIRKLKDQATLDDPLKALSLAKVAAKALTMDPPIASVSKLLDLSTTLKKVPTSRITFMTMPTTAYRPDPNRVAPDAVLDPQLFDLIAHDQSVTAPTPNGTGAPSAAPKPTPSGTPTIDPRTVKDSIVVENGTRVDGRSNDIASIMAGEGFSDVTGVGYSNVPTTAVFYAPGHLDAATAVAQALRLPATAVQPGTDGAAPVVLRVGMDFSTGATFGPSPTPTTGLPSNLASQAAALNAGDTGQCVQAYTG